MQVSSILSSDTEAQGETKTLVNSSALKFSSSRLLVISYPAIVPASLGLILLVFPRVKRCDRDEVRQSDVDADMLPLLDGMPEGFNSSANRVRLASLWLHKNSPESLAVPW
jgi:hypothetical protein